MQVMHCAECGHAITQLDCGAYVRCCNGYGYWHDKPPTPEDVRIAVQLGMMPRTHGKWRFYKRPEWPKGLKAEVPR